MNKIKEYYEKHKESWLFTLVSELGVDLFVGICSGALALIESGNLTEAALKALALSVASATLRQGLREVQEKLK